MGVETIVVVIGFILLLVSVVILWFCCWVLAQKTEGKNWFTLLIDEVNIFINKFQSVIYVLICVGTLFCLHYFNLLNRESYKFKDEAFVGLLEVMVSIGGFFAIYRQINISKVDSLAILVDKIYQSSYRLICVYNDYSKIIGENGNSGNILQNRNSLRLEKELCKSQIKHEIINLNYLIIEYINASGNKDRFRKTLRMIIAGFQRDVSFEIIDFPEYRELCELSTRLDIYKD